MNSNYLVTGGAGFIGSHFVKKLIQEKKAYGQIGHIVILDAMTYAGDLKRLEACDANAYKFIKGNILDASLISDILNDYDITHVIHFAAESHVDRSLEDASVFFKTNVLGTQSLLQTVYEYWTRLTHSLENKVFLHISTDEVYGPIDEDQPAATELTRLNPGNPYSASKAAADQIVISYMNAYGFPAMITRSSNNYGQDQHVEKLIPKILRCLAEYEAIPIYGEGLQKRCWLNVEEHCEILMAIIKTGVIGGIYNIKGSERYQNIELARLLIKTFETLTSKKAPPLRFVEDRKAHDTFYHIEDSELVAKIKVSNERIKKSSIVQFAEQVILNHNS